MSGVIEQSSNQANTMSKQKIFDGRVVGLDWKVIGAIEIDM